MTKAPCVLTICTVHLDTLFLRMFTLQVPPAMKAGSFFCEELLSLEIFWSCYKLHSGDSLQSLELFHLQRVLNTPTPLTIIPSVWVQGCGREDEGNVGGGVSWRLLDVATWELAGGRGLGASDSRDKRREEKKKKNNLVIQSVLFFCTISWTPLTWRRESM